MKKKFIFAACVSLLLVSLSFTFSQVDARSKEQIETEKELKNVDQLNIRKMKKENRKFKLGNKSTLIFVLDEKCKSCLDYVSFSKKIEKSLNNSGVSISILWKNKNLKREASNFYHVSNMDKINVPLFLLSDNQGNIVYRSNDMYKFISKFFQEIPNDVKDIIRNNAFKSMSEKSKLDTIVYFNMFNCPDCKKSNEAINEHNLKNKYNIYQIDYDDEKEHKNGNIDVYNFYSELFEIDWYPTFIIQENKSEYKKITSLEDSLFQE